MKKLIPIVLLLLSCSDDEVKKPVYQIDPLLQPFVDQFYSDADKYHRGYGEKKNLIARFRDVQKDKDRVFNGNYGVSYTEVDQRIIVINKSVIDGQFPGKYKSTIYREMAHMLLGKQIIEFNCSIPAEIMCIYFCPCEDDGILWQNSLDKLFK